MIRRSVEARRPAFKSRRSPLTWAAFLGILAMLGSACSDPAPEVERLPEGRWRAVLESPGGELPFAIRISKAHDGIRAVALNDTEQVPFTSVSLDGDRVILRIDGYDSQIEAVLSGNGRELTGEWRKRSPQGYSRLPFRARHGEDHRFSALPDQDGPSGRIDGHWKVTFVDEDGEMASRGEFVQNGDHITGTFLTPIGDYRYLEGDFRGETLRLSCFDGAHAFLFVARQQQDGTLKGDFWSRDSYHAVWTGRRLEQDEEDALPNPYQEVWLRNNENRFSFSFPDLEGRIVSDQDARFQGKVLLVNIFGSWCPNCNDEAPLLADWHRNWRERGLEIVGLAYEISGDRERDREFIAKFARRHGIQYPLLQAGLSDKEKASSTLPDLSRIRSFPTTIFVDRRGKVRRIHSGFAGPATGRHHERLVQEFETLITLLLSEEATGSVE